MAAALSLADQQIAGATLSRHLDQLWAGTRPTRLGWKRLMLDPMHALITLPAQQASGELEHYHFRVGAEYYDVGPPSVLLVELDGITPASFPSRFFPKIESPPSWFGLHPAYAFPDGTHGQLVCFSFTAGYYLTNHIPKETEQWVQGRHTVAATLNRLAEILGPKHYRGPSAC
jgi:hypothetical protein